MTPEAALADPVMAVAVALLGATLILLLLVGISLIALWFLRKRQEYAYDRLPLHWGEPLIQERTLSDVVADLSLEELQAEYLGSIDERDRLRGLLEDAERKIVRTEQARKRALRRVDRLVAEASVEIYVPQLQG